MTPKLPVELKEANLFIRMHGTDGMGTRQQEIQKKVC